MTEDRAITPSSGNVFADLGLPDAEALLAQADETIAKARKWDIINEIAADPYIDPYELPGHIETAEQWYRWRHEQEAP